MKNLTSAEFAVLSLLGEAPCHGYELERLIEERGLREWTEIGFSSIYFLLDKLRKSGLVEPLAGHGGGKSKRPFRLTGGGERVLVNETRRTLAEPQRHYPRLLLGLANWPAIGMAQGTAALAARGEALQAEARRLAAIRDGQQPRPVFVDAMFDYAIGQIEAEMAWLRGTVSRMETAMDKIDFKRTLKALYRPPAGEWVEVDVPRLCYVMIDGVGDPNSSGDYRRAVEWLYAVSYAAKFAAKTSLGKDYVVPPLEGLWWADDPRSFIDRRKEEWRWTMMIMAPDFVDKGLFEGAVAKASRKFGARPESLRLAPLEEGLCLQTLHIGSYDDEGPALARLHGELMPSRGYEFSGPHHEIYLGDPRKVEPSKLKTILRQPVRQA
ncbi:hypothetical protein GN330_05395 [Nitratireductor sp. CAU 1489]|uniref:Uncharacterized protein n=1 Tax=Nitratireductor arenosus TaxID=2682096 RepID=A0A844QFC9_9HYPH|nr:GyrI-like domain-containing protein [Nitratireductor arenosus]MVA96681.1 hypothetical protein [Nitratireductor arenosus]